MKNPNKSWECMEAFILNVKGIFVVYTLSFIHCIACYCRGEKNKTNASQKFQGKTYKVLYTIYNNILKQSYCNEVYYVI
jgi:hypothetical protein